MKKVFLCILAALILGASSISKAMPRSRVLIDEGWRFQLGESLPKSKARRVLASSDYEDSQWRRLDLPHDWSIELPPSGPGQWEQFQDGVGWYRKTLKVAPEWVGQRVVLEFEGVYCNPEVFVNGRSAARHAYGYTPFTVDLTDYIRGLSVGESLTIAVRVDNSARPSARWGFSGSGIYRHVWLHVFGPTHIAADGIHVTSALDIQGGREAVLCVETSVRSFDKLSKGGRKVSVQLEVFDLQAQEERVATAEVSGMMTRAEQAIATTIKVPNPRAWSPESPNLYKIVAQLRSEVGELLDEYSVVTGIRTLAWSAERGLELNGASITLNGGNVHHDNGILGAAAFDRAEEIKVKWLKEAGFNAVRTAHNPFSRSFLEACDRLGLFVIDEIFDVWGESDKWTGGKAKYDYHTLWEKWHRHDLEAWLRRDRHHPSVIFWSIGNEIPQAGKPGGIAMARELVEFVRLFDSTRPITLGQDPPQAGGEWLSLDPVFSLLDAAGYNYALNSRDASVDLHPKDNYKVYPGSPRYLDDHERVPHRIMFASESFQAEAFTNWKMIRDHPYVIGDFVWTAIDYLGDGGLGLPFASGVRVSDPHWWRNAYCGDIDITGWRKPISHYREILWRGGGEGGKKLYASVRVPLAVPNTQPENVDWTIAWSVAPALPTWTWPGHEGAPLTVEVYSRYDAVRLYLNGEKIAELPTGEAERHKALFTLPYEAGELGAVGLKDGKEVERFGLKTANKPVQLRAVADRSVGDADAQDILFVTIEAVDEVGQWHPHATQVIEVQVEGAGTLIGLGTANSVGGISYPEPQLKLFQGRALAAIRTGREPGPITVRVTSPVGLAPAELRLEARAK